MGPLGQLLGRTIGRHSPWATEAMLLRHGDFYPGNVMIARLEPGKAPEMTIIDWSKRSKTYRSIANVDLRPYYIDILVNDADFFVWLMTIKWKNDKVREGQIFYESIRATGEQA